MRNRDKQLIGKILEELEFVERSLVGVDLDEFLCNGMMHRALFMSLLSIGECVNHFSKEFTEAHTKIAWCEIVAIRNVAAHGYWNLRYKSVWAALTTDAPMLKEYLLNIQD